LGSSLKYIPNDMLPHMSASHQHFKAINRPSDDYMFQQELELSKNVLCLVTQIYIITEINAITMINDLFSQTQHTHTHTYRYIYICIYIHTYIYIYI
jgi:hypothetical protein